MKRDVRQKLLALSNEELNKKIAELELSIVIARQEKRLQDKKAVNVKQSYQLRKQVKLLKAEQHRRLLEKKI